MLSILGFIAVFIAAYFVYKTAKDTGRNAVGWALLTLAVGIGIQIMLPILIGFVIGMAMMISGSSVADIQESIEPAAIIISLVCLALSFVGIWLIMRRVSVLPEDESFVAPPQPPTFDGK